MSLRGWEGPVNENGVQFHPLADTGSATSSLKEAINLKNLIGNGAPPPVSPLNNNLHTLNRTTYIMYNTIYSKMYVNTPFGGGDLFFTLGNSDIFRVLAGTQSGNYRQQNCTQISFEPATSVTDAYLNRDVPFYIVFHKGDPDVKHYCYLENPDAFGALCTTSNPTESFVAPQSFTIPYEGLPSENINVSTDGFLLFINGTNMLKANLQEDNGLQCSCGTRHTVLFGRECYEPVVNYSNNIKFASQKPDNTDWGAARFSLII